MKISYDFSRQLHNFLRKLRNEKNSRVGGIFRVGRVNANTTSSFLALLEYMEK